MFIDTSAIVAVICGEREAGRISKLLEKARGAISSPLVRLETSMVLAQRLNVAPSVAEDLFDDFLEQANVSIVPITDEIGRLAVAAFETYGKGRHPARLNLSDCFSYAVAKSLKLKIIFIGNDFSKTDLKIAH
jgi:ribonuclease VapC